MPSPGTLAPFPSPVLTHIDLGGTARCHATLQRKRLLRLFVLPPRSPKPKRKKSWNRADKFSANNRRASKRERMLGLRIEKSEQATLMILAVFEFVRPVRNYAQSIILTTENLTPPHSEG